MHREGGREDGWLSPGTSPVTGPHPVAHPCHHGTSLTVLSEADQSRAPSAHRALAACPSSHRTRVHTCAHTHAHTHAHARATFPGPALTPLCESGPRRVLGERAAPSLPGSVPVCDPALHSRWLPGRPGFPEDGGRAAPLSVWLREGAGEAAAQLSCGGHHGVAPADSGKPPTVSPSAVGVHCFC